MSYSQGYKGAILRARSVSHSRLLSFLHIRQVGHFLLLHPKYVSSMFFVSPTKKKFAKRARVDRFIILPEELTIPFRVTQKCLKSQKRHPSSHLQT